MNGNINGNIHGNIHGNMNVLGIGQLIEIPSNGNMNGNVHGNPIINLLEFNGVIQCGIANAIKPTITWGFFCGITINVWG